MKPPAVYVMDRSAFVAVFGPAERQDMARLFRLQPEPLTRDQLAAGDLPPSDATAIISGWGVPRMDEAFLRHFPALRVVFHAAGSVKSFVTDALWERGIRVTCAASINAIPVAEFAFAQIILGLKQTWQFALTTRTTRRFERADEHAPAGAFGSTVGLLSLGHTGRLVAERLRTLDVRVIAYDPFAPPADAARLGIELATLDQVFAQADVVSCHTPLLPETVGLLRGAHFRRMKSGATFINTARGAVVAEPELIEVLRGRPDLFAVLDVTHPEPPAPDSPLFTLPNVVLTPHIAGSLGHECHRLARMMIDEAGHYFAGRPLIGEVIPAGLPTQA